MVNLRGRTSRATDGWKTRKIFQKDGQESDKSSHTGEEKRPKQTDCDIRRSEEAREVTKKRRTKRKMNRDLGKAGFPARRKSRADMVMIEPPLSVQQGEDC